MNRIIEKINRHVPAKIRTNSFSSKLLTAEYKILVHTDDDFKKQINDAVSMCRAKGCNRKDLNNDILKEFVNSWIKPVEYARFELFNKSRQERRAYIPDFEEIAIFKKTAGNNILPDSKYERYLMFKEFFHRQVLCISPENRVSDAEYRSFISGKDTVVIKPLKGTKGHGVAVVETGSIPDINSFKQKFTGSYLVEEMIQQGEELSRFHPGSVNTVRFVTGIDHSNTFHYIFALVRIGRGGSIVDNVASGGMVVLVDMKKGEICTPAYCRTTVYETHPDTDIRFCGSAIPQWSGLLSMVRDMHLAHPGQRMFGFDLAWTKNGWDLVEVNPAPSFDSYQELVGKGIRPYLKEINMI